MTLAFNKGSKAIEQQIKAEEEARKASRDPSRIDYWGIKGEGDEDFLRFITDADGWIHVKQHQMAKTKPAPKDAGAKWPKSMSAICRYDPQLAEYGYTDCYICDNKVQNNYGNQCYPNIRVWALAVRRHVVGDGFEDVMEEYDILDDDGKPTGQKGSRPEIVLINQSWSKFFSAVHHVWLASSVIEEQRSILNYDFFIRRTAEGKETDYGITPMNPATSPEKTASLLENYQKTLDAREASLEKTVVNLSGDQHYARWFDVTKAVDKDGNIVAPGAEIPQAAADVYTGNFSADGQVSEEMKAKLARLRGTAPAAS